MAAKEKDIQVRALLVEDNDIIIESLTELLKSMRFIAVTARLAVRLICSMVDRGNRDCRRQMRRQEGLEVLEEAKRISPSTTRLLLTGRINDDAVQAALRERLVYRYISKPWLNEDLILTLRTAEDYHRVSDKIASLTIEKNDLARTVSLLEKAVA